jgi:hypothetical protein
MKNLGRIGRWTLGTFALTTVVIGAISLTSNAQAGPPVCPKLWAPVICDNGKTYPNQCYADRAHATGCVPTGDL